MFYSELSTDRYIRETFFPDYNYKGIMVEVGAGPETEFSASKHWRNFGWRAICIEPNPKFVEQHRAVGNEIYQYACSFENKPRTTFQLVDTKSWPEHMENISYSALELRYTIGKGTSEIEVEVITLNTLLESLNISKIDLISIDVEGWELEVLRGFDIVKYAPQVVLLENYEHRNAYQDYMQMFGYSLAHKIDYNYIFNRNSSKGGWR